MAHDVFAPDLVRRYTCIGHLCTEPLSVSRPVHLDTRSRWIRVATRGVHVLRDVRIPTRVYTSRVPGTRQLHADTERMRQKGRSLQKQKATTAPLVECQKAHEVCTRDHLMNPASRATRIGRALMGRREGVHAAVCVSQGSMLRHRSRAAAFKMPRALFSAHASEKRCARDP